MEDRESTTPAEDAQGDEVEGHSFGAEERDAYGAEERESVSADDVEAHSFGADSVSADSLNAD